MATIDNKLFHYVYSNELTEVSMGCRLMSLKGINPVPDHKKVLEDPMYKFSGLYGKSSADMLKLEIRLFSGDRSIIPPQYHELKATTPFHNSSAWITLPMYIGYLPRDAMLAITIYDCAGPFTDRPVGGTTISIYNKRGVYRQGMIDLRVWPDRVADGKTQTTTPGKANDSKKEYEDLGKQLKKHQDGHLPSLDWLDRLAFSRISQLKEEEKKNSNHIYITLELQQFIKDGLPHCIVYYEKDGDEVYQHRDNPDIVYPDPEDGLDNLVEHKHHCLTRSLNRGMSDKEAKPNAVLRDKLNAIVAYPPTKQLTTEEQDLVWKYRFYLSTQKQALAKFLQCVKWEIKDEARQAVNMLQEWAPMAVEDALQLLSPSYSNPEVRRYAISRLRQASDDDLLLYLLQLVQALKYEDFYLINEAYVAMQANKSNVGAVDENTLGACSSKPSDSGASKINNSAIGTYADDNLATFLIYRACNNTTLANYLYWYLIPECEVQEGSDRDCKVREMYLTVMKMFHDSLLAGSSESQSLLQMLLRQVGLIDELVKLVKIVQRENCNRKKKIEQLQALIASGETFKFNLSEFEPIMFPLDPKIHIKGIIPGNAMLFKSNLMPLRLTFKTTDDLEYVAIFKHGDDLRQDEFVLQIITLMDKLLRSENLDLKLTPYRVLATGSRHGFVQYIKSLTIAEVLNTEGSIQSYLRKIHPSETGPYKIASDIMDTYVRSCAGYCVITYVLGVGDRHLDNLLLTPDGNMFHIDFGYILGREPKPFAPPMKLSKEMVEAMGGVDSDYYKAFRKQCYTAFLLLRRNANVILNLFSLMVNANVTDIALEPDKAIKKVQDNLRLDLADEQAVQYFINLVDTSVTAVMAAIVEQFHKYTQHWRK